MQNYTKLTNKNEFCLTSMFCVKLNSLAQFPYTNSLWHYSHSHFQEVTDYINI